MFFINEHLQGKADAIFPDDFPLLNENSRFVAYKNKNDWYIQTTLCGEQLIKKLKELEEN